jgi:hypothetical protein
MSIIKKHWAKSLIGAAIALGAATQASAHTLAAVTNPINFTWAAGVVAPVPGMVTPFFGHPGGRFVATFSAECAVNAAAGNHSAWLDVDIVVTNAAGAVVATLTPTVGSGDAFCSSNGTLGFDGWVSPSVTGVAQLAAGVYRVQVNARLNNGATGGWLGERTLVVSL